MAYSLAQCFGLGPDGHATAIWFRPGTAKITRRKIEKNQEVVTCESGRQVVTNLSANEVEMLEITFQDLQEDDETPEGVSIAGFDSLRTFVRDTAGYRGGAIEYKPHGASFSSGWVDAYLDQSDLTDMEEQDGLYTCKITLRRVIAP